MEHQSDELILIPTDTLSENWHAVSLNGDAAWELNEQKCLMNIRAIGTSKKGTGALFITKNTLSDEVKTILLSMKPGTIHLSGLVFNYRDPENFELVFIDNKGIGSEGYDLAIGKIVKGKFSYLCKETYTDSPGSLVIFRLTATDSGVDFYVNQKLLFQWQGQKLSQSLGIYSQQNKDAVFLSFIISSKTTDKEVSVQTDQVSSMPIPPMETKTNVQNLPVNQPTIHPAQNSHLREFLRTKSPGGRSIVDFKESFKVSLDSFYGSLYMNSELSRPKEKDFSSKVSTVVSLDYRPKRWYNEYKNLLDATKLAKNDVSRYGAVLDKLENNGLYPENVDFLEHDGKIIEYRKKFLKSQDKLEQLAEEKCKLFQEMRVAGYMIREENIPDHIQTMGYTFYIVGGIAGYKDFDPVDIRPGEEIGIDQIWTDTEKRLRASLFDNKRFNELSRKKYDESASFLLDYKSYLPLIQDQLDEIDAEIKSIDDSVDQLGKDISTIQEVIECWRADARLLSSAVETFHPYNSSDYPYYGGGLGPGNSVKFRNWLDQNKVNLKSFNYSLSADGNNFDVTVDKYPGFNWSHQYRLTIGSEEYISHYVPANPIEQFNLDFLGWPGTKPIYAYRTTYSYSFGNEANIPGFFNNGVLVCNHFTEILLPQQIEELTQKISKHNNNKLALQFRRSDIEANSLRLAREGFIDKWNQAEVIDLSISGETAINPDTDPLTQLMGDLESKGENAKIYYLDYRSDGFYTQDGQSIQHFVEVAHKLPHLAVLMLPVFDANGKEQPEVKKAIVNPIRSGKLLKLPSISFVESYQMEIHWKGYCLGELTKTVSLFPGESKEMVIETQTRLSEKLSTTDQSESTRATRQTDSFEDQLQNELNEKSAWEKSLETKENQDRKQTVSNIITDESGKTDKASMDVNAESKSTLNAEVQGAYGPVSGKVNYTQEDKKTLGAHAGTEVKTSHKDTKQNALETSQGQSTQKANKESKEALKKTLSNQLRKTASETSASNKVSFTSVKSTEFEETRSNKETIKIENPNIGRTVNYHFFQLQNIYESVARLVDVKIVVDPGIEVIKNSDLSDIRVYDLEEFNKVYANSDQKDPRSALLASIVVRQLMKNYKGLAKNSSEEDSLVSIDPSPLDEEMLNILNLSGEWTGDQSIVETLIEPIKKALNYLKGRAFRFRDTEFLPKSIETINTGAYYMDAEVGEMPATEQYLETRRDIETETKRAELDYKRAQTLDRVYFPEIPEGLTTLQLNMNGEKNPSLSTNRKINP